MWTFEQVHPDRSAVSGDIGKVFKNEQYKNPGALASGAPGLHATLIAREVIQNSWDAARALRTQLEEQGADAPEFRLVFRFRSLTGQEKATAVQLLGLQELASRLLGTEDVAAFRRSVGLAESDCLDAIDDLDRPLELLEIEERGTTGMDGPWKEDLSKLWLALVSAGFTAKEQGAGGSYGYGKAGLIRGSAIRTVLAHTTFRERDDDFGVTSRLLGMTYWGRHRTGDGAFTGFARLGVTELDGAVVPFENEAANTMAADLGLLARSTSDPDTLGSTFVLVQPTATADQLRRAVERNWWPAIHEGRFDVEIYDADGAEHPPRPKSDEVLLTFIRGYELATVSQDNQSDEERPLDLGSYQPQGSPKYRLGKLGLLADRETWSFAQTTAGDDDEVASHQSMVALVRGPRMIVEYYPIPGGQPYVRGAFVAHEDVDDLLRQTEPKAHDAWQHTDVEEGVAPDAPKVARELLSRIRTQVREFRRQLRPPPAQEREIRLPLLDDLFRGILDGRGTRPDAPPRPDPRPIAIRVDQAVHAVDGGMIRMAAHGRFALTDAYKAGDHADVRLTFRYAFDEDGTRGDDCEIDLGSLPAGFTLVETKPRIGTIVTGVLGRALTEFRIESKPYDADWSGQLILTGDVVTADTEEDEVIDEQ